MATRRRRRVHRRGHKSTTRRVRRTARARVSPPRRRRSHRRRRNWLVAGSVAPAMMNPRRRRRGRRRANPVRRHRRHARRNPAILGFSLPPVKSVLFAGVGFAGPSMLTGFLNTTFPSITSQITSMGIAGKYIMKIGSILGLAWLTRRFVGSNEAGMVLVGGGVNVALTAVNDFAPGLLPANPFSAYIPTSMAGMGAMRGTNAYVGLSGLKGGLAASRPPFRSAAIMPSVGGGVVRNGAYGGVAQRFFRY